MKNGDSLFGLTDKLPLQLCRATSFAFGIPNKIFVPHGIRIGLFLKFFGYDELGYRDSFMQRTTSNRPHRFPF